MELPEVHVSAKALRDILLLYLDRKRPWDTRPDVLKSMIARFKIPTIDQKILKKVSDMVSENYSFSKSLCPVAHLFDFNFENTEKVTQFVQKFYAELYAKWKTEFEMIALFPVICFLRIPDPSSIGACFGNLLELVRACKMMLSGDVFNFCLCSCVVHYVSHQSAPFSKKLAEQCFSGEELENLELVEFVMCSALKDGESECFEYLANRVLATKGIENGRFAQLIDPFLGQRIEEFDKVALKLVAYFARLEIDRDVILKTVRKVPEFLLKQTTCDLCFVKEMPKAEEPMRNRQKLEYKFDFEDSFPEGLSPIPTEVFDSRVPCEFPSPTPALEKTVEFLKDLIPQGQETSCAYLDEFLAAFVPTNDTMFMMMLFVMKVFDKMRVTPVVVNHILKASVFCPEINVFVEHSEYYQALAVRKEAFDFLIAKHPYCIPEVLDQCSSHPLLSAEMIGRIHSKLSSFDPSLLTDEHSIASMLQVIGTLKQKKSDERCQKARATIYIFIFAILDDFEVSKKFFGSLMFVSGFLPCAFQPSLSPTVLSACSKFLNQCTDPEPVQHTIEMLCALVDCCEDKELVGRIVTMVNNASDVNSSISPYMAKLVPSVMSFLRRQPTKDVLSYVVQFYLHLPLEIDRRHLAELSKLIKDIEGPEITDDTIRAFLCIMAKARAVSLGLMVVIQRYYILLPFLSLFSSGDQAKPFLDYLMRLCRYSPYNCYQCHRAELDLFLIEMMMCRDESFTYHGLEFQYTFEDRENIFDFVSYMLSIVSSAPVAIKAIDLMGADDRFLTCLNSCLLACQENIIPIGGKDTVFKVKSIQSSKINSEFSTQFWLRMDTLLSQFMNAQIILFSIIDQNLKIYIIAQGGSIVVKVEVGTSLLSAMLSTNFPTNTWSLVTIGFKRKKDKTKEAIFSYSLGDSNDEQYVLEIPDFEDDKVKMQIGSVKSADNFPEGAYPVCISGFKLFGRKLTLGEISDLLRKRENSVERSLYALEPERKTLFADAVEAFSCPSVFKSLLPVFYYFDSYSEAFPEMFLDFLSIILARHGDLDLNWRLIAYLLGNCKLTYAMYLRFFGMLDGCSGCTFNGLIDHILLNFELWTKCEQIMRIVQHWGGALHEACAKAILEVRPFQDLLAQICHYFYFVKSDPEAPEQIPDLDIDLCRQNLNKLALALARISFCESDAMSIISHAVNASDNKLSMLDLLFQIAGACKSIPESVAAALFFLLKPQDEQVFLYAVKIIYLITKHRWVAYCDAIIELMNQSFCTNELFSGLMEMMPNYPLIFPILIYVSIYLGDEEMQETARTLKTLNVKGIQVKKVTWLIMSLNLAIKLYPKDHDIVVFVSSVILSDFSMNVFDSVICIILLYGSLVGFDLQEFAVQVTKVVADFQIDSDNSTRTYLFLRCVTSLMVEYEVEQTDVIDLSIAKFIHVLERPWRVISMHSKLPKSKPLMETARRIYRCIDRPSELVSVFGAYFDHILREVKIPKEIQEGLDRFYPALFLQHRISRKVMMQKHVDRLNNFWRRTRRRSMDCYSKFTPERSYLAVDAITYLKRSIEEEKQDMRLDFKRLRKFEMNEFSIWKNRNMFFKEVRRCFRYNSCLSQVRIRKALNDKTDPKRASLRKDKGNHSFEGSLISVEKKQDQSKIAIVNNMVQVNERSDTVYHVRAVLLRYRLHHKNSIEILMKTGQSYLIELCDVDPSKVTDIISKFRHVSRVQVCKPAEFVQQLGLTSKWTNGRLSNFEYLMMLNIVGGRTFRDATMYPIFPWVIKNFNVLEKALEHKVPDTLTCSKESCSSADHGDFDFILRFAKDDMRDLSWPIAAQSQQRREELLQKFDGNAIVDQTSCIFMSTPSNSTTVGHWLMRQPPFTQLHLTNEDGKFGFHTRLFQSWDNAANQVMVGSAPWELVPEMFSQPEVLVNMNGYDMGPGIGDVYPMDKAIEFVYYHRKILESAYVSEHLNEWIDLMFGVDAKNPGRCNLYMSVLYDNVWDDPTNQKNKEVIEKALESNGQLSAQLFTDHHPRKNGVPSASPLEIPLKTNLSSIFDDPTTCTLDGPRVRAASLLEADSARATFGILDFDGNIYRITLGLQSMAFEQRHELCAARGTNIVTDKALGIMLVVERDTDMVVEATGSQMQLLNIKAKLVTHLAVSHDAVSVCDPNGDVIWWFIGDHMFKRLSFPMERIVCHAISTMLSVMVFATVNGFDYISDLVSNQISFQCDLKGRFPKKVLISNAMGFIAVYCDDCTIMLFTPNGHFIRQASMNEEIVAWKCFKGLDGFDYLIIGDAKGNLRMCELFYLDFAKPFYQVRGKIVMVEFHWKTRTAFVLTEDNQYVRIPIQHFCL